MRARSSLVFGSRPASRLALALALSLVASAASAQIEVPQFDLDHLVVDSSAAGSLVVGTGEILPVGAVRFALTGDYQNNPYRYFEAGEQVGSIIRDRYTVHVVGGFAPVDWLELGLDLPIIAVQNGGLEVVIPGLDEPVRRGLGSPTLTARGALFSQAKGSVFDVAFQLGAKIPLGSDVPFANDAKIGLAPKLMIGRNFDVLRAGIELGAHWRPGGTVDVNDSGDPLVDDLGSALLVAGVISTGPSTGLRGELSGRTFLNTSGKVGAVELLLGARYPIAPNMEVYALAGPGLGQAPGTPQWRVMVGAAFGNGQGITGTPSLATGDAGASQPAGTTSPAPATPTVTPEPAPSNPFPPFTPPPGMYPPATQYPPQPQTYPQPTPAPQTYPPTSPTPQPADPYPPPPPYNPAPASPAPAPAPAPSSQPPQQPPSYQTYPG